ncbi:hypothetical protein MC885_002976 [Smutsia gigantea]|nr:hypothetical protein MC885_002976 [Smutsia gigantea]
MRSHCREGPFHCPEGDELLLEGLHEVPPVDAQGRIHRGEKPFQCPECDRSFCLKGNFKSHLLQHSGKSLSLVLSVAKVSLSSTGSQNTLEFIVVRSPSSVQMWRELLRKGQFEGPLAANPSLLARGAMLKDGRHSRSPRHGGLAQRGHLLENAP